MHVDGFRFDLASILSRDESGRVIPNPPVLLDIESDPVLAGTKLIAEAWDAAGLYQVGSFIGDSWKEWNGRFRDDVRSCLRGEDGVTGRFADRVIGSPSLYDHKQREPEASVNFVTCHDGFTLNDLVSYDRKQMKRTARTIATALTTTEAGTVEWKARRTTRLSRSCEPDRSRTSSR
jgi:glycogen operon protein